MVILSRNWFALWSESGKEVAWDPQQLGSKELELEPVPRTAADPRGGIN